MSNVIPIGGTQGAPTPILLSDSAATGRSLAVDAYMDARGAAERHRVSEKHAARLLEEIRGALEVEDEVDALGLIAGFTDRLLELSGAGADSGKAA